MKNYRYLFLILLVLGLQVSSQAQSRLKLGVNYTVGIPVGSFRNITDALSGRGVELRLMADVSENISVGIQGGYQDFYKRLPRQVYSESGSDLSAVVTNSIQVQPILAKAQFRFGEAGGAQPFVSLGAGANLISFNRYYGEFRDAQTVVRFAAQPELGVMVPVGAAKRTSINVAAAYNYMPFTYDDVNGLHNVQLKAGVLFRLQ
jgi:hypothetical protein